jgi:ribonucleoside-diphosphate reductase alpha chain
MDGVVLTSLHPAFVRRARIFGLNLDALRPDLATHPSIQHLTHIPEELHRLFVTAHDVSPEHHVRMQAVFQRYGDSGVSKTINLAATATKAEVAAVFLLAYNSDAKASPSFVQAAGNDKSFPAGPASLLNLASVRAIPQQN